MKKHISVFQVIIFMFEYLVPYVQKPDKGTSKNLQRKLFIESNGFTCLFLVLDLDEANHTVESAGQYPYPINIKCNKSVQ